uniref:Uncharacterized protein n=1 Tax=Panagrolaimus davidi TaxID=227884 RepID=A0A914PYR0_9BILA
MRQKMAKARRKLHKARRKIRKVIGRKKNFSADDVLEFNRQMYRINDYDQRFLIINFLLTFPDEQWKKRFIEKNGIEVVWSWLTDYENVGLKTYVRLQNGLIKFLDTLPVEYNDHLKSILVLLKDLKDVHLPDDIILQETLNDLVDCVVSDEPEIDDKDLARMMERDKVSMIKLYDETVEICKRLYEDWSKLPSLLTEGCVEISGDEMEKSGDEPAETSTSPHASSSPEMMDADFDTPEDISQPVDDIDIGAKNILKSHSRLRSRSYSPRRQKSRSRSSVGYAKFLKNAIKKDYRYRGDRHYESRRYEDRRHDRHRDDHHYDSRQRNHRHRGILNLFFCSKI